MLIMEFKISLFPEILKRNIDKFYEINLYLLIFSQENCVREFCFQRYLCLQGVDGLIQIRNIMEAWAGHIRDNCRGFDQTWQVGLWAYSDSVSCLLDGDWTQKHMPEIVNEFDLLDESWLIGSCLDCYIEGDSTAESGFFGKGHRDQVVMFLMIKVRRLLGVLASGLLTISGLVSTIRVFIDCHYKGYFLPVAQNSQWTNG